MRAIRVAGNVLLWTVAVIGVLSGALWVAHALGWVQPLVVVSGSMQPKIARGDLLIATPVPADELRVGEVATLYSTLTDRLVTHRVISVDRDGGDVVVEMQGDANGVPDPAPYRLDADAKVWHPVLTIPRAGDLVLTLSRPNIAIPLAIAVLALVAASLIPRRPGMRRTHLAEKGA